MRESAAVGAIELWYLGSLRYMASTHFMPTYVVDRTVSHAQTRTGVNTIEVFSRRRL